MQKTAFKSAESEFLRNLTFSDGSVQFVCWDWVVVPFSYFACILLSAHKMRIDFLRITTDLVEDIGLYILFKRSCHVESEYLGCLKVVGMCRTIGEKVRV